MTHISLSPYRKTIIRNQVYHIQLYLWKFLLYPPLISITLGPNSYLMQVTITIINSQKYLGEAREKISLKNSTLKNI